MVALSHEVFYILIVRVFRNIELSNVNLVPIAQFQKEQHYDNRFSV
jgi:hypothetical protein